MIERLVLAAEQHRALVLVLTACLAVLGLVALPRLRLDALPDVTTNQVIVLTNAPGFTPEEVEQRVTRPVELALGGTPGLVTTRSISRYGISSVTAVFEDEIDPFLARQMVTERITTAAGLMPEGVEPPELGPYTGGLGEIFHFTLRSSSRTPTELLELVELRVAPRLRGVAGVVEVNTWGGGRRTLDVIADPMRMAQLRVTFDELRGALESASASAPGASVPAGSTRTLVRAVSHPRTSAELGATIVHGETHDVARVVRIADVADVREGALARLGAATSDGRGESVYVMVQMAREQNARRVVAGVRERMVAVRAALPRDVEVEVVYDRRELVDRTLETVGKNLLEGGLLVTFVLFLLLGSVRAGLLVASTIPLAMLGAVIGMVWFGIPGNLMSLGAIDFGLLVDGGVVMVESFFHRLTHEREDRDERALIRATAAEVARPVFYSVGIIALVYVPILTLSGVDGKMFRPMALTVIFALVTALVLSLTFVPAAASYVIRRAVVPAREPRIVSWLARWHAPLLGRFVAHPRVVLAFCLAALVAGGVVLTRSGFEFVPQLDEGDLVIQTTRAPDIRIESAIARSTRLERALRRHVPEVTRVTSRLGSPAVATDIMGIEQADILVALAPHERWRPGLTRDALLADIERVIERDVPGSNPDFTQPIQMRFNELLGGSVSDVAVTIFGEDLGALRTIAERAKRIVEDVPGATDVRISAPPEVALLDVRPNALDASHSDLSPREVVAIVQSLESGIVAGETFDGPRRIPIRLRLGTGHGDTAHSAFGLASTTIPVSGGRVVPLSRVARVTDMRAVGAVEHTDGERRISVGFNVRGRDLGTVVAELTTRLDRSLTLPPGYRVVYGGQYETMQAAYDRLGFVVPIVLVLILAVLTFMFSSLRTAAIVFAHVPFACIGGVLALAARGMPVSISAAVGFIALSGIAVLNGVVLMTRIKSLETSGHAPGEAASMGARERMRPVMMTAAVAALGFVPMMLGSGVGSEVQRPLATVVVGGLVTSTMLTLLVLPSLYPWFARVRTPAATDEASP
jgi:cobalt-zinc-cadmium resistance protein CzcA